MLEWTSDDTFAIAGVEYVCRPVFRRFRSTASRFCLLKARWAVDGYVSLCEELAPRGIVEVGIYEGGSTAFLTELAPAARILAVDVRPDRSAALDAWTASRSAGRRLVAEFGVDQADSRKIGTLVEQVFATGPIDLVIDDASHELEPSRRTFDALFPRLAPGGVYVIEDWFLPLTPLVTDVMIVAGQQPDVVVEVTVRRGWAIVRRGPARLDPATFALADLVGQSPRAADLGLEAH